MSFIYESTGRGRGNIEVTEPGVSFIIDPQVYTRRFPVFPGGVPEQRTSVLGSDLVRMGGDPGLITVWNEDIKEPNMDSLIARIREENGFTEIGSVPGEGHFTISYSDEDFAHEKEFDLRFTRLNFDVSIVPNGSGLGDPSVCSSRNG